MIRNEETGWVEASIIINGDALSFPEAMTLRVALSSFRIWIEANQLDLGELAQGYEKHAATIERLMITGRRS